ncbi:MAG: hypothetical protein KAI70_00125 [Candidatus Omnitrophica bacterium]|nr:hypothetical protein [Candidatus Omnitrophota bacterium]
MKKTDLDKMMKKYEPTIKKTGDQLSKAMKAAEKDVAKFYQVAQTHIALQLKNLQKEKLYHEIGKYVADKMNKGSMDIPGLEKYKKRFEKLNLEGDKIKHKLSKMAVKKTTKKKV